MKQLKLSQKSKTDEIRVHDQNLEELRAQRKARIEINHRVESLKVSLMRMSEHNMDHTVRLLRRWLNEK